MGPHETAEIVKSTSGQIQDGVRRQNWKLGYFGVLTLFDSKISGQ